MHLRCMGVMTKILRVTAVKTNVGGRQYTLIKMITEMEEKILEDEGKIVEQINQKNKVCFLGKECIT